MTRSLRCAVGVGGENQQETRLTSVHPACRHCNGATGAEPRIAHIGRRAADMLDSHGANALSVTAGWKDPLRAARLDQASHGGDTADPTAALAILGRTSDMLANTRLKAAMDSYFDAAATIVEIVHSTRDLRSDAEKVGTGQCADCGRYCKGEGNDRLRNHKKSKDPVCDACRKKLDRAAKPDSVGGHSPTEQAPALASAKPPRTVVTGVFKQGVGELAGDELVAAIEEIHITELQEGAG